MDNKKIIIKAPEQLKGDLSNTKAFDGQENESFFHGIDLYDKNTLNGYFEGYKVLYFAIGKKLLKPINLLKRKELLKELKEVKKFIFSLEEVFDDIYKEKSFYEKGNFSLNLKTNKDKENNLDYSFLDKFYFIKNKLEEKDKEEDEISENTFKGKGKLKNIKKQINNWFKNKYLYSFLNFEFEKEDFSKFICFLGKNKLLNDFILNIVKKYPDIKEEIKKILDDKNWKVRHSIIELLKVITQKDLEFVKCLFNKKEIKKRLDDENWSVIDSTIELLKVISEKEKDLEFVKDFKEEIKKRLDYGNWAVISSTTQLLKVIAEKEKDLEFVKDFKEEIKKRLDDENLVVTNLTTQLLKVIAEKDLDFVKGLFEKEEIKKRLDDENLVLTNSAIQLLKVIAEKDLDFVKGLFDKEELKTRLGDDNSDVRYSTIQLLKVIAEKDLDFVKGLFDKEQIKKRLDDENSDVIYLTIQLLKVIAEKEKDLEFVKDFKEEIKKRLDDEDWNVINSTIQLLKVIAEKDLEFVIGLFEKEELKTRLGDENSDVIYSTLELLKVISEKDLDFVKGLFDKEKIKKILDFPNLFLRKSTVQLLKVISEKDLDFVKGLFDKEEIKKILDDEYWEVRNSTIELLKVIAEKDLEFAKKVLSFKNNNNFSNQIKDFIQNHTSGSCLLSGYRGVGKTSTISKAIYELQQESKNQEQKIIKIIVNIPELDDDKKLDKKSLLDRIVINTYREIDKIEDIKDFKDEIKYLYTRIYNDVEKSTSIKSHTEFTKIELFIENILKFIILLEILFLSIIGIGFILLHFDIYIYKYLNIYFLYQFKDIPFIKESIIPIILLSSYLYKKWKIEEEKNEKILEIYTPEIAENKLVNAINKLFKDKKYKIVFVIDELDKLLDFDKVSNSENTQKQKIDMKQVFDVLGKLKTLFFESKGAIFFVVTNKESYDYYLLNKHQEDDMISNIFNKIIYLPANSLDDFHIHHNVKITGGTKQKDTKNEDEENDENNSNIELREKIKNYIYFKSHGNWRKSKFELSQMITGDTIEIDQDKFDFEYKFYEFFVKIYKTFEKGSIENEKSKEHLQEFLFNTNGQANRLFEDTKKIEQKQNTEDKNDIDLTKIKELLGDEFYNIYLKKLEVKKESKEAIQELKNTIDELFYKLYLQKIKELIISKKNAFGIKEENITVIEYIDFMIKNFTNNEKIHKRKFFGYFVASIETVSLEYAYRDYIMNNLLNIFENINFLRKTTLDEVLKNIKINKDDLEYPAFKDMMIFWLPVMIIYFNNTEAND